MQALCPACNLKKGNLMQIDLSSMRPGQRRATQTIIERIAAGESHTSIVLPTRYGKSDVIRLAALQLSLDQLCCGAIVMSPGGDLRNQIVRKTKIQEMCARYGIAMGLAKNVHEWKKNEINPFANNPYLLSVTIHYANFNRKDIASLINSRHYTTGLPVVVFVDETHMVSSKNEWGKTLSEFVANGAVAVLLTATADRADGCEIPGFKYEVIDTEDHIKTVRTREGRKVRVDIYEGVKQLVAIKPDCTVTFKDAWDENPSPLCTLSRDCVDVNIRQVVDGISSDDDELLSSLTPAQARLVIGKACRDERVIRKGVSMMVTELERARETWPDLAAIVFTGHDEDGDSAANEHANTVRKLVESMSDLTCVIATAKSDDDTVSNHLQKFASGNGDVLIVKNAGGAGFDCSRLKVLLDLSSVRTFSSTVQRLMRVATPHGKVTNAVVITLADTIMDAIWDRVVSESGGEWSGGSYTLLNTTLIDPAESPQQLQRAWVVEGTVLSSYDDTLGNCGDMSMRDEVEKLLDMFPVLGTVYTKPVIASRLAAPKSQVSSEPLNDEEVRDLHTSINGQLRTVIKRRMAEQVYSPQAYQATSKAVYREMFVEARVDQCPVEMITDIETLKQLDCIASHYANREGVAWL
jgi:superfamily II DNA or RNA helicase